VADSEPFNRLYDALHPRVRAVKRYQAKVVRRKGKLAHRALALEIEESMGADEGSGRLRLPPMPKLLLQGGRYTTDFWLIVRALDELSAAELVERPAEVATSVIVRKLLSRGPGRGPGFYEPSSTTPVRIIRHRRRHE